MKKFLAVLNIILLALMASTAFADDSSISNLQNGGLIQPSDYIGVVRSGCTHGGNCKVQVGSAAPVNIGTSGATLGLLNTANTFSALQTFLTGDLAAADPVFTGGSILLPAGTTGARPSSPLNGMIRYNTSLAALEAYVAGVWGPIGSGSGGSPSMGSTGNLQVAGASAGTFAAYGGASCTSHHFFSALDASGTTAGCSQPAFSDISGSVNLATQVTGNLPLANMASIGANTLLGETASGIPVALAVPSCSGSTNALSWTPGVGLGCNTISAGGGTPGGTSGQVQYNNAGSFGGFTLGGDGTLNPSTGVLTITQSYGAFNTIGNFSVATNKMTVAAASGNTLIAGTLGVTGQITGNLTGNVTGNASTATALASAPSQCTGGQFATGIATSGNANCSTPSGSGGLTVASTSIASGTTTRVLFDNAGVLGEYGISGTTNVAMTGSPTFTGTVNGAAAIWSGVDQAANFVASGTGANTLPSGSTAQRPGSPVNGQIRYNSDATPAVEAYVNSSWEKLGLVPDRTVTIGTTVAVGDMGGQVNFNGSSITATIPAISTTVLPANQSVLLVNQNASALALSSTPTVNNCPTSLGALGWCNVTSNGTSLDGFGFPGFGTITSNALLKFSGTGGVTTASGLSDSGTVLSTAEAVTLSGLSSGTVATNSYLGLDASNHVVLGAGGTGGSTSLNSVTAASATNSIDNLLNTQTWNWSTLASQIGFALSSTSTAAASNTQELFDLSLSGANGTTTQTTYAEKVSNTHTGTSSTNVGEYLNASGGTTNIALQIPAGLMTIGTTTPLNTAYDSVNAGITVSSSVNSGFDGVVVQNKSSGNNAHTFMGVQNDANDYGGFQVNSSSQSVPGAMIYLASKSITFLTDITGGTGGTDSIRFQTGGYNNALTFEVTGGNPGKVRVASTVDATNATMTVGGAVAIGTSGITFSPTAPTVASGFGSSPTIGTGSTATSFDVNVGTGGSASSGVITMPTAAHQWVCSAVDGTNAATMVTVATPTSTTQITLTNYGRVSGTLTAWTASDDVSVKCAAH